MSTTASIGWQRGIHGEWRFIMPEILEDSGDRLVLRLDPGGPVELAGLTESFAGIARMYARHYRVDAQIEPPPRLYVTRLESGSIVAEIAPYAVMMGALITTMGGANTIGDFARRLSHGIRAFADPAIVRSSITTLPSPISRDDAADIRAFVRPLTGKNGASLNIKHARLAVRETPDGDRHTVIEYSFDENELNKAAINIDDALAGLGDALQLIEPPATVPVETESLLKEVMLFFEQASRRPGKERGRTGDKGIVPDISAKSLPVYFRKSFQDLKEQMIKGEANPLTDNAFIVDVYIHRGEGGEPNAYFVTNVHRVVPLTEQP